MLNYYKILGIENFSSVEMAKEAYRSRIREYHPDVSNSEQAKEITQYLNEAKNILTDPEKKINYDQQLQMAYYLEIQKLYRKQSKLRTIAWRRKERDELEKLASKKKWEAFNKVLPLPLRLVVLCILAVIGLYTFYTNYFVTYNGNEMIWASLGITIFVLSISALTNQIYTHYYIASLTRAFRYSYERIITLWFILLVFGAPVLVSFTNEYRKGYQLSYYAIEAEADLIFNAEKVDGRIRRIDVLYRYEVDGHEYVKKMDDSELDNIQRDHGGKINIKYSKLNPSISEPVFHTGTSL